MNDVAVAWKGLATTSSFGGVDDEAATNDRATQTDLRSEKKNIAATGEPRVQARVHLANVPPLPYPFPIVVNHGQKRRGGERPAPGAVRAAPLLLPHGRPAVGGERAGGEGRSPHGAAVRRRRRWSGATTARRGVPMRPSAMDLDVAPATMSATRRLAQLQYPRRRGSSAPPVLPPAAARPRPRQRWWRRRGRGAALGQMRGRGATWTVEAA